MIRNVTHALFVVVLLVLQACGPTQHQVALQGEPLPDFELPLLGGGEVTAEDLKQGDLPVVLNFWATWCSPCVREIPTLQELHLSGKVKVVSISLDTGDVSKVKTFVEEKQMGYPVLLGDMGFFQQLGGSAIPYTLILDSDLTILAAHRGLVSKHVLERGLADAASRG